MSRPPTTVVLPSVVVVVVFVWDAISESTTPSAPTRPDASFLSAASSRLTEIVTGSSSAFVTLAIVTSTPVMSPLNVFDDCVTCFCRPTTPFQSVTCASSAARTCVTSRRVAGDTSAWRPKCSAKVPAEPVSVAVSWRR